MFAKNSTTTPLFSAFFRFFHFPYISPFDFPLHSLSPFFQRLHNSPTRYLPISVRYITPFFSPTHRWTRPRIREIRAREKEEKGGKSGAGFFLFHYAFPILFCGGWGHIPPHLTGPVQSRIPAYVFFSAFIFPFSPSPTSFLGKFWVRGGG